MPNGVRQDTGNWVIPNELGNELGSYGKYEALLRAHGGLCCENGSLGLKIQTPGNNYIAFSCILLYSDSKRLIQEIENV